MSLLCAFEACARLGRFTAAAHELHLTQSAVSRQIKALEDFLGVALFIRERQTVRLSPEGERYAHEVREALRLLAGASLGFRANPQGGSLTLAILPTFGTRWLAPRLPRFLEAHPGVTLHLVTRLAPFDFRQLHPDHGQIDAAIHYGEADWPGAELDFLLTEEVVPACSPAFLAKHGVQQPADLQRVPLLHLASRPDAWRQWLALYGVAAQPAGGMVIDQFAVVTQAAMAGLGVALLPRFLFQPELDRGDLVAAVPAICESVGAYHLACAAHRLRHPPLQAFRAWLQGEVGRG
ncbi:LysR family transcriptional regulator [Comamonas serinivorans]